MANKPLFTGGKYRQGFGPIFNSSKMHSLPMPMLMTVLTLVHGHSNLIWPKPRNAVDSNLPQWHGGKVYHACVCHA